MLLFSIGLAILLILIALYVLVAVYLERKVSAFIQDRMGPMEVGKWGLLQTLADILKLLSKEIIIPSSADKWLFLGAPMVVFVSIFAGFAVLPFAKGWAGAFLNVGILWVLSVISIHTIGLLMAGWGSNNKYALIGSFRAVSQIISYEIPAGLTILAVVLVFGTLDLNSISQQQGILTTEPLYLFGIWDVSQIGGVTTWSIVRYPHLLIGFIIFFIASLAECNRAPFDIPEAESELLAGFHIEYSGFTWAIFFLAEYANMLLVSFVAVILFLGGWNTALPNVGNLELAKWTTGSAGEWSGFLWGSFWLCFKTILLILLQMWIRWTYPRFRADQLMRLCWKVLIPTSFGLVIISIGWKLAEVYLFSW